MAELRVIVEGGFNPTTGAAGPTVPIQVTPVSSGGGTPTEIANQGTPNTLANAWPIKFTDGSNVVTISSSASIGSAMAVSTGSVFSGVSLNAVTANGSGTAIDMGSARSNWTAVGVATGAPTGGTVTLELSVDGTTFVSSGSSQTITAAGNFLIASTGRPARYARTTLSGLAGTIVLTTNLMAAG